MKYADVYVVKNEGEGQYASTSKEAAEEYADEKRYNARQAVLDDWGNDDPSEKDIYEADFQAGFDGGIYEVEKVNIMNKKEDDVVEFSDGSEIEVSEILEKLD